jgi:Flp pilus assembly protein TadG
MNRSKTRPASRRTSAAARCRRGIAASEFALVAPVFFLILLATTDLVRTFRAQLRMEMVAVQLGQIVSQCTSITNGGDAGGDTQQFWAHAARIAGNVVDINSATGGTMMVTAVSNRNNANYMNWRLKPLSGNATTQSIFGAVAVGGAPTLRGRAGATFLVPSGQTLLVTEVYGVVRPWLLSGSLLNMTGLSQLSALTMFLTRSSEPARLQETPRTSNTRECTA